MKLFCFPYAGGTASFFGQLERWMQPVELVKLEYAGHGKRHRETFDLDFCGLADNMYSLVRQFRQPGEPYALLGYSMGSVVAVEVLRRILRAENMSLPVHVFLAAHGPATRKELLCFHGSEADEWIKQRTISFGGVPDELACHPVFWRVYLPVYRSDYQLITRYDFKNLHLRCNIPASVFYSETDTPLREVQQWHDYFVGPCSFIEYSGNHFFIREHVQEMAEYMKKCLEGSC